MENINRIGNIGDIFIRRDGKECIWVASNGKGKYKYRFRLLSEHNDMVKRIEFIKNTYPNFDCGDPFKTVLCASTYISPLYGKHPMDSKYITEEGDWYVRYNGATQCCCKWEDDRDIIKKK